MQKNVILLTDSTSKIYINVTVLLVFIMFVVYFLQSSFDII